MSDETTYERTHEAESYSDYSCLTCDELTDQTYCWRCRQLREAEANAIADAFDAAKKILTEAHDARWEGDTRARRQKLKDDLKMELGQAFKLATGGDL